MKFCSQLACAVLGLALINTNAPAQTAGSAKFEATVVDYSPSSSGTAHWTVGWITSEAGTFIKSFRKQGPSSWTTSHWGSHCPQWYNAKGSNTNLDGYSSATAPNYTGTNSPVVWVWNCRDANNALVPDGNYKFWIQYAEDSSSPGPYSTNGILWTKGSAAATNNYSNFGNNLTGLRVAWTPAVSPTITSPAPSTLATVGVPYNFTCTATGTMPITFSAVGLPAGLSISSAGVISGTPTAPGDFSGNIIASNGVLPNASQPFSITVNLVPITFTSVHWEGSQLIMNGTGPANGKFAVLIAASPNPIGGLWPAVATNFIDGSGNFSITNTLAPGIPQQYYRLRLP